MSLEMEYKICDPLKTRHIVPWEQFVENNKVFQLPPLAASVASVRKAAECGWYEGDKPNVDDMLPAEVVALSTAVLGAYSAALGFDAKKLLARRRITPKV